MSPVAEAVKPVTASAIQQRDGKSMISANPTPTLLQTLGNPVIQSNNRAVNLSGGNTCKDTLTMTDSEGFTLPTHEIRRQRRENLRKKKVIAGSGNTHRMRGAPEPSREIFVYRYIKKQLRMNLRNTWTLLE